MGIGSGIALHSNGTFLTLPLPLLLFSFLSSLRPVKKSYNDFETAERLGLETPRMSDSGASSESGDDGSSSDCEAASDPETDSDDAGFLSTIRGMGRRKASLDATTLVMGETSSPESLFSLGLNGSPTLSWAELEADSQR